MIDKPLTGIRIIIVEDAVEIAMDISNGLRMAGALHVELKASLRQAQKRLVQQPPPDVVLLDYNIVGSGTGVDLALWMRNQPALSDTVRILYSGSDLATLRARLPDSTVFHQIISKPAPLALLIQQIAELVRQHRVSPRETTP